MSDIQEQEQEQDQDHTSSASEASGIIQQMNTLTDVESGLAEAHLAVESQAADVNSDEIAIDDDAAAAAAQTDAFMAEAEKVEGALESAIPPAPSSDPRLPAQAAPHHESSTATVTDAQQTIDIVNADIPAPVLPEQVAESAHDVVMETHIEEETSPMQVDVEEEEEVRPRYDPSEPQEAYEPPQRYDPSEPQDQAPAPAVRYDPSEPQGEPTQAVRYDPSEPQDATPVSYDPSVPQTTETPSAPPTTIDPSQPREPSSSAAAEDVKPVIPASSDPRFQQQSIKTEEAKTEFPSTSSTSEQPFSHLPGLPLSELPAGITEQSPSVVNNKEAANGWRANHKDTQALLHLFGWSIDNTEIDDARAWYTVIEKDSPSATQPLLSLVKLEQALNNFPEVENLFSKAINGASGGISDVAIWKQYLQYIRRQNPVVEGATLSDPIRAVIIQAYDFALKDCGTDRASGEIWQDYLQFLSVPRPTNDWEEQQKQDSLRKAYHKATCIPLDNVEALWKAYDAFENNVNKQTAKKFLAERSPAYMTARTALKDLQRLTDPLYAAQSALPPKPSFSGFERGLITGWKAYLKWEQENKLVIEDKEALAARIKYAMKQCVGQMRHFPELWHYVSTYHSDSGDIEEAVKTLKAGIVACPSSVLLTFACADLLEIQKDTKTCHEIYTSLIENLTAEVEDLQKTVIAEVEAAKGPEIPNAPQTTDDEINMSDQMKRLVEEREGRGKMVEQRRGKEVIEIETAISISWIMYMRCTRRSEGIKAARVIFGKARRGTHLTWHIFEASAMMEFHSNKDAAVAIKIFDLGAKKFPNEVDYVIKHLQFLLSINDDTNARALFERSALNIPPEKARPLWDAWARYEYMYGDLAAVNKLEARFKEVFPNDTPLKRLAQRFTYNGVDQIGIRELGLGRQMPVPMQMQMAPPPPTLPMPQYNGNPPPNFAPPPTQTQAQNFAPPPAQIQNYRPPSPPRRNRSPSFSSQQQNKRQRPSPSYNPPPRAPPRDDRPVNRYPSAGSGPPPPAPFVPPPRALPPRASPALSNHGDGLPPALPWFIGQLPSNRSYDGPVYRPEHIIRSFDNIARDGTPLPPRGGSGGYAPPPPTHGGYAPPAGSGYGSAPAGYGRDLPPSGYRDAAPSGYGARSQGYDYRR